MAGQDAILYNVAGMSAESKHTDRAEQPAYYSYTGDGELSPGLKAVPEEVPFTFFINDRQWVTLMCTPISVNFLAIGFLYTSRIVRSMDDILYLRVCEEDSIVEVRLPEGPDLDALLSRPRTLTSGCGGGTSFEITEDIPPVTDPSPVDAQAVLRAMHALHASAGTYREVGGIHTCALAEGSDIVAIAEDVGRHNAVDKLAGECLWKGLDPSRLWLLSSGRISSEMALKAGLMGIPVVISHTAVTSLAIEIARRLNLTLIGYARNQKFNVYTGKENIAVAPSEILEAR